MVLLESFRRLMARKVFVLFAFLSFYASDCLSEVFLSVEQAQVALFSSAHSFEAVPIPLTAKELKSVRKAAKVRVFTKRIGLWRVTQVGAFKGWFLTDKVIGKHELITYALAVDAQGTVIGLDILEYLETHGGEVKQEQWRKQFVGKNLGNSMLRLGKDIDGLSGATLSSRNVTDGVRKLLLLLDAMGEQSKIAPIDD